MLSVEEIEKIGRNSCLVPPPKLLIDKLLQAQERQTASEIIQIQEDWLYIPFIEFAKKYPDFEQDIHLASNKTLLDYLKSKYKEGK